MLTEEEVRHIASLARIGLDDEEVAKYRAELSKVLDLFGELQSLDTSGEEPAGVPEKLNDTREDIVSDFPESGREAIMKNVPDTKQGSIKVRSVF